MWLSKPCTGVADLSVGACAVLLNLAIVDKNRHQIVHRGGAAILVQTLRSIDAANLDGLC